jgi:hypothetical protein
MTTTVDSGIVTTAIVSMLRTTFTPIPVGEGVAPTPAVGEPELLVIDPVTRKSRPYLVVTTRSIGAAYEGGNWTGQPESIERLGYAIYAVGIESPQAEGLAAAAIGAIVDRDITAPHAYVNALPVPGHSIIRRRKAGKIPADVQGMIHQHGGLVEITVGIS